MEGGELGGEMKASFFSAIEGNSAAAGGRPILLVAVAGRNAGAGSSGAGEAMRGGGQGGRLSVCVGNVTGEEALCNRGGEGEDGGCVMKDESNGNK